MYPQKIRRPQKQIRFLNRSNASPEIRAKTEKLLRTMPCLFIFMRLTYAKIAISQIGIWIQNIAISWLVYDITKSPPAMGTVMFFNAIPLFLLMPFMRKADTKNTTLRVVFFNGSEGGIRTHDTRIMIPPLYRLSYPAIKILVFNNPSHIVCQ